MAELSKEPAVDVEVVMKMSELRELAQSLLDEHEARIGRLERFANKLAQELGEVDATRVGLRVEEEPL